MTKTISQEVTIKDLQRAGIPIHTSHEYFREWPRPKRPVSLERVRAILSKLPGSLAATVSRLRDEEG